jgi:hypothetical protein
MSDDKKRDEAIQLDRRQFVRKGAKAAYVVPAVLAAVKATERPAYAQGSGAPISAPVPVVTPAAP